MSRRTRNWVNRSCYHLTHRCHNKEYFFKRSLTRDTYLKELREMISRFRVDILNYTITCNHIHLLVYAGKGTEIEKGMQYLQGRMAQRFNMFSDRQGSFWSDRYHATLIESGTHLRRCLFYIDFNMVRAGVVKHPSEWKHGGYHELNGNKKRNVIINFTKLLRHLRMEQDKGQFWDWYNKTIDLETKKNMERQKCWSEALAVGSKDWIGKIKGKVGKYRMIVLDSDAGIKYTQEEPGNIPELQESSEPYAIY